MRPYLAGDDAARAADLRAALTDPGIAGIVFARGGYGAQRTLEAMDWAERLGPLAVPMLAWANVGHGGSFQTFPLGIAAELDADRATLRLLDPPLS
jgi:muramoyltetrapeptide carboxypeptidase LdcA involved in peptidoglycan recycling